MVNIERRIENRDKITSSICSCRIPLLSANVKLNGRIIDASERGLKLQIPFIPSLNDTVYIADSFITDDFAHKEIPMTIKWLENNDSEMLCVVGCETSEQNRNLKDQISKWS